MGSLIKELSIVFSEETLINNRAIVDILTLPNKLLERQIYYRLLSIQIVSNRDRMPDMGPRNKPALYNTNKFLG